MPKITTGILHDAEPLSVEQVKELEREVLENQKILVYLDTNKELCFSMPDASVDSIKCLAWNHAYELIEEATRFVKNSYKKDGLYSFYLDKVLQKKNLEDAWEEEGGSVSTVTAGLYETGAIALYEQGDVEGASKLLKTSWADIEAEGCWEVSKGDDIDLPPMNEYGFYFGVPYSSVFYGLTPVLMVLTLYEDGSAVINGEGQTASMPEGTIMYNDHSVDMSSLGFSVCTVSADGKTLSSDSVTFNLGTGRRPYSPSRWKPSRYFCICTC